MTTPATPTELYCMLAGKRRVQLTLQWLFALLVLFGLAYIRYGIGESIKITKSNAAGIRDSQDMSKATRAQIEGLMARTVERWDKLSDDNPDMSVPKVVEPLPANKKLTDKEMTR